MIKNDLFNTYLLLCYIDLLDAYILFDIQGYRIIFKSVMMKHILLAYQSELLANN